MAFAAFAAPVLASAASGLVGKLFGGGGGGRDKLKKLPTMSPQQQQLLNSLLGRINQGGGAGQALSTLQSYLNPQGFDQFSQPYMQQFNEQVIPGIAERFAGAGALSSSGFGQALGGAASGLQSQLAQLYSGRQQQAANSLLGFGQNLLGQQPFAYLNKQRAGTFGQGMGQGLSGALPGLLSSLLQGNIGGGGQGNYQFPLTGMYENMFRSGAAY